MALNVIPPWVSIPPALPLAWWSFVKQKIHFPYARLGAEVAFWVHNPPVFRSWFSLNGAVTPKSD